MVYENCEQCQRAARSISRRDEMPQQPMLYCEVFDIWGIDFLGLFPPSFGFSLFCLLQTMSPNGWKPQLRGLMILELS